MIKNINIKHIFDFYCIRIFFKTILTVSMFMMFNNIANAGGLIVYKESLRFIQYGHELKIDHFFDISAPIEMEFRYDAYAYAGKPYHYGIFKVYKKENTRADQLKLVGISLLILSPDEGSGYLGRVMIKLPEPDCSYEIQYHVVPYVAYKPLESAFFGGFINEADEEKVEKFYKDPTNSPVKDQLAIIKSGPERYVPPPPYFLTVYIMNFQKVQDDILAGRPLTFQWDIGPETSKKARNIQYSYRLAPTEDWTIYSDSKQATYDFLRPGIYSFQVKARYTVNGKEMESRTAHRDFTLDKQIFRMTKAETRDDLESLKLSPEFFDTRHYNQSRALLIGVPKYQEMGTYSPLAFVNEDIRLMKKVLLKNHKFEVDILKDNPTKGQIEDKLEDLLRTSRKNDRIIIYFSCHGAQEGEIGFLVPYNARSRDKGNTCISYEYLKGWIKRMMTEKEVKAVLIVLDSCHSGLGLYSKSARESPITELAEYPSAHMMTAGLVDQVAFAERDQKLSVFTRYLVEGLKGQADYTNDDLITLTELLVFVQDRVSRRVEKISDGEKKQTPVMGKIMGAGEMLFFLR
ncbi:MAG: triple tyrosine motif-containing protein [Candidatus Hodarchaeota archaeon]